MESRKQKNSVLFFVKSAAFLVLFFLLFCADAKPFVLKSVDGSWLPMIAQKWEAKNGGVLVKLADGIKPNELRDMLVNERIPNLSIEVNGRDLFFPTTTPDSLFELLKNIDLDVPEVSVKRQASAENSEMFVKSSQNTVSKEEYAEGTVENAVFEKNEKIILTVNIQQRAKTGVFPKLYGIYKIEHTYNLKNGIVDPSNVENIVFLPLVTAKKGSRITFVPEKLDLRVLTITSDFKIK